MSNDDILTVHADDGEVRLDRFLKRRFPALTQARVEKLLRTGQIRVDGARAKSSDRVGPGTEVRLPPPNILHSAPPPKTEKKQHDTKAQEEVRKLILYEDHDVLVLNKPFGIPTQGGTNIGDRNMDDMVSVLAAPSGTRPKLVHRLDRDTTGVLVFGKTHAATAAMAESFRDRDTKKVYWAIVLGVPRPMSGQIRSWMRKDYGPGQSDREMMRPAIQKDEGAVHAITDYMVVQNAGQQASWLALRPVTGRTHQLRFHMAEIGCAIAGDPKYKCDRPTPGGLEGKLLLHARAIEIPHPQKGLLRVIAPLPPHMQKAFALLGLDERDAKNPFEPFE